MKLFLSRFYFTRSKLCWNLNKFEQFLKENKYNKIITMYLWISTINENRESQLFLNFVEYTYMENYNIKQVKMFSFIEEETKILWKKNCKNKQIKKLRTPTPTYFAQIWLKNWILNHVFMFILFKNVYKF